MIAICMGKIGGGKTYLAVSRILAHLARGGTVYTNVEMNPQGVADYLAAQGVEFDPAALVMLDEENTGNFHQHLASGVPGLPVLCVIDEAHLWFAARDHAMTASTKAGLIRFLSQSRKLLVDVVFIVQHEDNLDPQFRRLCQELWVCKDLARFKVPLLGIGYPWQHSLFFRVDRGSGQIMEKGIIARSPKVWNAYNTNALLRPVEFAGRVAPARELAKKAGGASWLGRVVAWEPSPRLTVAASFVSIVLLRLSLG